MVYKAQITEAEDFLQHHIDNSLTKITMKLHQKFQVNQIYKI